MMRMTVAEKFAYEARYWAIRKEGEALLARALEMEKQLGANANCSWLLSGPTHAHKPVRVVHADGYPNSSGSG